MRRRILAVAMLLALLVSANSGCANTTRQSPHPATPATAATPTQASTPSAAPPLPHPGVTLVRDSEAVSIADVVEQVLPSVVSISSTRTARVRMPTMPFDDPFFRRFFGPRLDVPRERREQGLGSGVVVAQDIILTNNHVVDGAQEIKVSTFDKQELDAKLVGSDPKSDLAVLRLQGETSRLKPIRFGDSSRLRLGDVVVAIGNPFGVGQTVTMGIVSAKGRAQLGIVDYEDFIQTDAAINPGNSGGALVNTQGELVGINTAILSRTGGNVGIGFAIPTNMAKPIMDSILQHGKVVRGWLGVSIQDLTVDLAEALGLTETRGVLIAKVHEGTPAAQAGLKQGDVILKVNGERVDSTGRLRNLVAAAGASTTVRLELLREGKPLSVSVKLGELPTGVASGPGFHGSATGKPATVDGLTLKPLHPSLRQKYAISDDVKSGLVVTDVKQGSVGALMGLRPGDVVLEINRKPVSRPDQFKRAWQRSKGKILLLVHRRGATLFMAVQKPSK